MWRLHLKEVSEVTELRRSDSVPPRMFKPVEITIRGVLK
jgi:hypothetical protein